MPTWRDIEPRQKQPKMRADKTGGIGIRQHLRTMLDDPDQFQGGADLTVTLDAPTFLRVLKACVASDSENMNTWIAEAIHDRLHQDMDALVNQAIQQYRENHTDD